MQILPTTQKVKPTIVFITDNYYGFGFAKMCLDAGYEVLVAYKPTHEITPELEDPWELQGEGIFEKMPLDDFMKQRAKHKNNYIIFDNNAHSDYSEKLRAEKFKVFGGSEFTCKMEDDRDFGISLVKKAGLTVPDTEEFQDTQSGIEFLENNEDRAFVFKPDEPDGKAWVTTVPDNEKDFEANEEMRRYLESMGEGQGSYILQERKKGVEINVEIWLFEGQPFFASANFESKKKYNKDLGKLIGCAQDITFTISLDCKILKDTLLKLIKLPEFKDFTGPVDMNLIVADRQYYFLEFCGRLGYNYHPNLFINLALKSFPEIMIDWLDGNITDFYENFRMGFGASVSLLIDTPVTGLPLIIPEDMDKNFYHYDSYKEGDRYFLCGYDYDVGIICGHDYDLKSAADAALDNFDKIHYPGRCGRTDINLTNYLSNPHERWVAAQAMKLFDK